MKLTISLLSMVAGLLLSYYTSYVVVDLSDLFNVPYLQTISQKSIFGLIMVIRLCTYRINWVELEFVRADMDETQRTVFSWAEHFLKLVFITIAWGLAYVGNWLFF